MRNFLTLSLLALAAAASPARADIFTLTPSSPVLPGASFDVTLELANAFSANPGDFITSIGFDVSVLDSTVATYTGFTPGSLFFDASFGNPDVFVIPNDPGGLSTASAGYTDPFTIAVLHFNALQAGNTTIEVTTDPTDINQGLDYFFLGTEDFSASTPLAVVSTPEPGGFGLLGLVVCAIGLCFRRRPHRLV